MGDYSPTDATAVAPCSDHYCLRAIRPAHHGPDDRNAQDYSDNDQGRSDCSLVFARSEQKQTTCQEYDYQINRRAKGLHGLVYLRVNTRSGLLLIQPISADRGVVRAPLCRLVVSERLLRHRCWQGRLRFIRQIAAHSNSVWSIGVQRSNSIRDRGSSFRHVRYAALGADRRHGNSLRGCRHADGQGGHSGEFIEGIHFEFLRNRLQGSSRQLNKVLITEIDHAINDTMLGIPSAGGLLDFVLAALKKIDRLGILIAEPIPEGNDRNSTGEKLAPVGHRKTNMLSRVRIDHRGPTRVTNDRHGMPLLFSVPRDESSFLEQQAVAVKRPATREFYFYRNDVLEEKSAVRAIAVASCRILCRRTDTVGLIVVSWHCIASADALDIAGAA